MKIFKTILLVIILISIYSCSNKQESGNNLEFNKYPSTIELTGQGSKDDNFVYVDPHEVMLIDTLIIITTFDTERCIYIYHKNNFKQLASVGHRGQGPNEIIMPGSSCLDRDKKILWMEDWNRDRIAAYPIDSILSNSNFHYNKYINYPREEIGPLNGIEFIDSDHFLVSGRSYNGLLFIVNKNGEITKRIGNLPKKTREYALENYYFTHYNYWIDYLPAYKKAIVAYDNFDLFEIYNIESGQKIKTVRGPDHFEPVLFQNGGVSSLESKYGYSNIKSDSMYIYLQFSGQIRVRQSTGGYGYTKNWPKRLHIHDLDGNPVMNLKLDMEYEGFIIDKETKRIITFGVPMDVDEGMFRIYDYPEELLN